MIADTSDSGPNLAKEIDRGIEVLRLALRLQSEKDGVQRSEIGDLDKTKVIDSLAKDANTAATHLITLRKYVPLLLNLAEIGHRLEKQGKIKVDYGGSYPEQALAYFEKQY